MSKKTIQVWIPIPKGYRPDERIAIGQDIVDFIIERSKRGVNKDGHRFKKYTKEYERSLDFTNAGKTEGKVDLTLSGDMLAALKILDQKPGAIKIGYQTSDPEAGRAEGNILGTYGQSRPTGKARDFLGITEPALRREVLSKYPIHRPEKIRARTETVIQSGDAAKDFFDDE